MRLAAASLTILTLFIAASATGAYTATEFRSVPFTHSKDSFYNWDFTSRDAAAADPPDNTHVDWPMNLLFYGNADVDKVKAYYELVGFDHKGVTMYGRVNDGYGKVVDPDKGKKEHLCPGVFSPDEGLHFRLYAPLPPDHLTSGRRTLRAYVLGTSHYDIRECGTDPISGASERAEEKIAYYASRLLGSRAVDQDYADWKNDEIDHLDDHHFIETNGKGTRIRIR